MCRGEKMINPRRERDGGSERRKKQGVLLRYSYLAVWLLTAKQGRKQQPPSYQTTLALKKGKKSIKIT